MHVNESNTGNIIFMYQTGERVKIDSVTDEHISIIKENGTQYLTKDRYIEGIIDDDPSSTAIFENNALIGKGLNAARASALKKLLSDISPEEKQDADLVWKSTEKQLEHLNARIAEARNVANKKLVYQFLSDLYERGSGSHDYFMGHRVEVSSSWNGEFKIDGKLCDIETAADLLFTQGRDQIGAEAIKANKPLAEIISSAESRQRSADSSQANAISHNSKQER